MSRDNRFFGLHTNSELQLTEKQKSLYSAKSIADLYPEYYIIKVGKFNDVAKDTLDEWVYYLKNNRIKDEFTAQGIGAARELLAYDNLTPEEKLEHDRMIDDFVNRESEMHTSYTDGEFKGRAEGRIEGRAEGLVEGEAIGLEKGKINTHKEVIANGYRAGFSAEIMATMTGLTPAEIMKIIKELNIR